MKNSPPQVGIFWIVKTAAGDERLLAAGCLLADAEPYGDCLTYGPGHYDIWEQWRMAPNVDPPLRAIVLAHEYEDWPRGRIVFDQLGERFILYADRKLMVPDRIVRIRACFRLPAEGVAVEGDLHYQSRERLDG